MFTPEVLINSLPKIGERVYATQGQKPFSAPSDQPPSNIDHVLHDSSNSPPGNLFPVYSFHGLVSVFALDYALLSNDAQHVIGQHAQNQYKAIG